MVMLRGHTSPVHGGGKRQARVCMALARASDDPALKQYYEELALKFAQNAVNEHDDITVVPFRNLDSGNTNRHGRANKP